MDEPKEMPVRIEPNQYAALKELSEKEGIRISWAVNRAIAEWLEKRTKK